MRRKCEVMESETVRTITNDGEDFSKVYAFRLRYSSRITKGQVISVNGDELIIEAIENVSGMNKELIINAVNYNQD